jgi:hypothetical protein
MTQPYDPSLLAYGSGIDAGRQGSVPKTVGSLKPGKTQADVARTYNVDAATICRLAAASPFAAGAAAAR